MLQFFVLFIVFIQSSFCFARQPYHALVTVNTEEAEVSAPNLVDLDNKLKTTSLELLIAGYTPTSPVSIAINLRGIDALTSFAANSNTLVVNIPQAGITKSFTGSTREESLKLFKEFVRDGGSKHRLLRAYAKYSPIDPIAGNPNSLMAEMADADYAMSHLSPSVCGCDRGFLSQPIVHQFQAGLYVTRGFSEGFDTTSVILPFRYSYSPTLTWALIIDAPFVYNRNGGASSVFGSCGIGFKLPITPEWALTSVFRAGAGGSLDLCTSGCFLSTSLVSTYQYQVMDYLVVTMTNDIGYFASANCWLSGINFNYRLYNGVFKNGLAFTPCQGVSICDLFIRGSLALDDTYFTGHRLYMNHYDELSFSLIANHIHPCLDYDCLSLRFAYQFGNHDYRGYRFDTVYQF